MSRRRIIYDEPGQTCNRFWSYLESVAWAVHEKKKVYILFWDPSLKDYDALRNSRYVSFPFYCRRLIGKYGENAYLEKLRKKLASQKRLSFYVSSRGRNLGFTNGWQLREADVYFPKVKDKVVEIFRPNVSVVEHVEEAFSNWRKDYDVMVGVHIRRGDYKEWRNGAYYFDYEVYARFMKQIAGLFPQKKVGFYIASNEPVPDTAAFDGLCVYHGLGGAAHDLFALQISDYIIGPPSTFSKWASVMGGTPLHIIYDRDEVVSSVNDFSPLVSHTKFQNGKVIW